MRDIVYYVAASIDGFIAGPQGDISGFTSQGTGVQKYLDDLPSFDTVIMGRKTYEFGYRFGLRPGQAPYPHMRHYIFSTTLRFDQPDSSLVVCKPDVEVIKELKADKGTAIYLCGGGEFAGWLLEHGQIDVLKVKLNPFIQGEGVRLFGNTRKTVKTQLIDTTLFEEGLQIMTYRIKY
jgi:dihydrofolate reductase